MFLFHHDINAATHMHTVTFVAFLLSEQSESCKAGLGEYSCVNARPGQPGIILGF